MRLPWWRTRRTSRWAAPASRTPARPPSAINIRTSQLLVALRDGVSKSGRFEVQIVEGVSAARVAAPTSQKTHLLCLQTRVFLGVGLSFDPPQRSTFSCEQEPRTCDSWLNRSGRCSQPCRIPSITPRTIKSTFLFWEWLEAGPPARIPNEDRSYLQWSTFDYRLTYHTVEKSLFIKSYLASSNKFEGLVWCKFGHVTFQKNKPSNFTVWVNENVARCLVCF